MTLEENTHTVQTHTLSHTRTCPTPTPSTPTPNHCPLPTHRNTRTPRHPTQWPKTPGVRDDGEVGKWSNNALYGRLSTGILPSVHHSGSYLRRSFVHINGTRPFPSTFVQRGSPRDSSVDTPSLSFVGSQDWVLGRHYSVCLTLAGGSKVE